MTPLFLNINHLISLKWLLLCALCFACSLKAEEGGYVDFGSREQGGEALGDDLLNADYLNEDARSLKALGAALKRVDRSEVFVDREERAEVARNLRYLNPDPQGRALERGEVRYNRYPNMDPQFQKDLQVKKGESFNKFQALEVERGDTDANRTDEVEARRAFDESDRERIEFCEQNPDRCTEYRPRGCNAFGCAV